jgi:hypothetical protein
MRTLVVAGLVLVAGASVGSALDTPQSPAPAPSASPAAVTRRAPSAPVAAKPSPSPSPGAKKPGHVYSNEDIPGAPAPPTVASPGLAGAGRGAVTVLKPAEGGPEPSPEPTAAPPPETTEGYWQERAINARAAITEAQQRVADLEKKVAELRDDRNTANAMDPNREQHRQSDIAQAQADLERARADLERQQKALSDLEEDARRKSIPPGWLRERPER